MHRRFFNILLFVMSLLALRAEAEAVPLSFDCISFNSAANCIAGELQLSADLSDYGNDQVLFSFYNAGPAASSIEGVYFDDGTLLGLSSLIDKDEGGGDNGVDFTGGSASPPNLPGANTASPSFNTTSGFLADSDPPTQSSGVNPGEWLGIVFDLQAGKSFNDVVTDLETQDLRIGMHVIGFSDGKSESFVNLPVPVPVPSSALLLLTGLGAFGLRMHNRAG